MALAIDTEFHRHTAIRHVIGLCVQAKDLQTARSLFNRVQDASQRKIILQRHPECLET
jgi:hypothetical protein